MENSPKKSYTAHLDSKNRLTIREAKYEYYHVKEYPNGCLFLEPRVLSLPADITPDTLENMDKAMENYKHGIVYGPVDLSEFES